ncbi:hypothetical protein Btru_000578 [Bulinus truncatus]|nr:hypothetical protein Btru_000578 [Bulinus truncatus]
MLSVQIRKLRGDPAVDGDRPEVVRLDRDGHLLEKLEHLELSDYQDTNLVTSSGNPFPPEMHINSGCYIVAERKSQEPIESTVPVTSQDETPPLPPRNHPTPPGIEDGGGPSASGYTDTTSIIPLPGNTQYKPSVEIGQRQEQGEHTTS